MYVKNTSTVETCQGRCIFTMYCTSAVGHIMAYDAFLTFVMRARDPLWIASSVFPILDYYVQEKH